MPFMLRCGLGLSALFAIGGTLAYAFIVGMSLADTSGAIEGKEVEQAAAFSEMPLFFLAYPAVLLAFGAIAYGLWRERVWTRVAMMVLWAVGLLLNLGAQLIAPQPSGTFWVGAGMFMVLWAIAAWYLYGKASVQDYYRAILATGDRRS